MSTGQLQSYNDTQRIIEIKSGKLLKKSSIRKKNENIPVGAIKVGVYFLYLQGTAELPVSRKG